MNQILTIVWLGLVVLFLVVEAACPIHLVSLWFAAGALTALAASLLGGPLWLQLLLFLITSGGLLVLLWPLAKKYMNPAVTATNVDAVIGTVGIVTVAVDNIAAQGQIALNGLEWTARSTTGEGIPAGEKVRVDRVEGVKAYVTALALPVEAK